MSVFEGVRDSVRTAGQCKGRVVNGFFQRCQLVIDVRLFSGFK